VHGAHRSSRCVGGRGNGLPRRDFLHWEWKVVGRGRGVFSVLDQKGANIADHPRLVRQRHCLTVERRDLRTRHPATRRPLHIQDCAPLHHVPRALRPLALALEGKNVVERNPCGILSPKLLRILSPDSEISQPITLTPDLKLCTIAPLPCNQLAPCLRNPVPSSMSPIPSHGAGWSIQTIVCDSLLFFFVHYRPRSHGSTKPQTLNPKP
jgi:hypothetical protein